MKKVFLVMCMSFILFTVLVGCDKTDSSVKLTDIAVGTENVKVEYNVGEEFSANGLEVTATYSDKTTKAIALTSVNVDSSAYDKNQAGTYQITVSFQEKGVTKTATFNVEVKEVTFDKLEIDTTGATTTFVIGDEFTSEGIAVSIVLTDGSKASYGGTDYVVDSSAYDKDVINEYEITVTLNIEGVDLKGTYKVNVITNLVTIDSVEGFLEMRSFVNADNKNTRIYELAADIDLAGVVLEPAVGTFVGSFDGKGYTIKNATFKTTTSKQGLMFNKIEGAVVQNVKFFACTVIGGASETTAIIAGECNDVGATFKNIEFSCCTVDNGDQNYAALVIGRNSGKTVKLDFENITVKNLTSVSSKQYVGAIVGDVIRNSEVNYKNCDIDISLNASNNISVFSGRNRGASVTVENAIVKLELGTRTTASSNQVGIFADGNSSSTITATNVAILQIKANSAISTAADFISGRSNNVASTTLTNVYAVNTVAYLTSVAGVTMIDEAVVTTSYLLETVLLPAEAWEADTNKMVKLIVASANTPASDATVRSLVLVTGTVDKMFFQGDAFNYDGLLVTAIYSDGCVVPGTEYSVTVEDLAGNEVSVENFVAAEVGRYNVVVEMNGVSEAYQIDIVKEVDITINHEFVTKVYAIGARLDLANLVVFSEISNGTHTLLTSAGYTVSMTMDGVPAAELSAAGEYVVTITRGEFSKSFTITVHPDETVYDTEVVVVVDKNATNASKNANNQYQFTTISQALNYLASLELDDQVIKTINVVEGTYIEKLTIDMPNVNILGEENKDVTIAYGVASGHSVPSESTSYGTDNSATVIITSNAVRFNAYNIKFVNTFDYNNSSLANRQALAVRCDADQSTFYECSFTGYQDTLEAKLGRQYYYRCTIEGCVDFIFGNNATAVFESCTIRALTRYTNGEVEDNNGYVCAPKGFSKGADQDTVEYNFVFLNCTFTAESTVLPGSMSIARPWGTEAGVVTINCSFTEAYSVLGYDGKVKSRYFDMSGNLPTEANFFEYGNTGTGSITEAVAGMQMLAEADLANYTLAKMFAKTNGMMEYAEDWLVTTNPAENTSVRYIVYYQVGQEEYNVGDALVDSQITVYAVTGNPFSGYTIEAVEVVEKFYNGEVEVAAADVTKAAGVYETRVIYNEEVIATSSVEVTEKQNVEVVNNLLVASDIEVSTLAYGATLLNEVYAVYGKDNTATVSVSSCSVTLGDVEYTKVIKLSGGTGKVTGDVQANVMKVVVTNPGKITVVASQKNATVETTKDVNLVLMNASGVAITTDATLLPLSTSAVTVTFEVAEAGTYYIGSSTNGFFLYSINYSYEKPLAQKVTYTLLASDIAESAVAYGSSFMSNAYAIYGKDSTATVSVSGCSVTLGVVTYTKVIKLSGGTGKVENNTPTNVMKVVATSGGTITVIASQKNAADADNKEVKLKLMDESGATLTTDATLLPLSTSAVAVTFEVSAAGTYYIGSSTNGFFLYSIALTVDA